jgi:hypothetical protein
MLWDTKRKRRNTQDRKRAAALIGDAKAMRRKKVIASVQPVSFDLMEASSIADKANAWLGRITSLIDGGESFKLNLLLGAPHDDKLLPAFIKAQNILHKMQCPHDFIREDQADKFAQDLKKEIEEHKASAGPVRGS